VIPALVVVNSDGTVNFRVPRNRNDNNVETDKGYVIYGPSGPQGRLILSNIDHVIPGETPTPQTNGTARLSSIPVIGAGSFQIELDTNQVNLLGTYRDHDADGDNALFKIDGGVDVTGRGFVSTDPNSVAYGFQQFNDVHSPGYFNGNGNGRYVQTINASNLSDGLHYLTVRAFRHRNSSEPPVFTDFREAIYIDHSRPTSQIVSFVPLIPGVNENQQLTVQTDATVNNVHVLFDLPAALSDAQVLSMINNSNQAHQTDRYLWTYNVYGLTSGNHVATVVSYRLSGTYNIQRFPGLYTSTIFGAGLGDLNFDGRIDATDVNLFGQVLNSNNSQFNPAADFNGDGSIDNSDLLLYYPVLQTVGDPNALAAYNQLLGPPLAGFTINPGDTLTLTTNQPGTTSPPLSFTWDINAAGTFDVSGANATLTWDQLAGYGISGPGVYPIVAQVTDGSNVDDFYTTLTVQGSPAPAFRGGLGAVPVFSQVFSPNTPAILSVDLGAALAGSEESSRLGFNVGSAQELAQAQPGAMSLRVKPGATGPLFPQSASLSAALPGEPLFASLVSPVLLADNHQAQEISG
jgi:Dockerin type I domain